MPAGMPGQGGSGPIVVPARFYTTAFTLIENPLSEGGIWTSTGNGLTRTDTSQAALPASSTPVVVTNVSGTNVAHGTSAAAGSSGVDDSYTQLSGFPPNQSFAGTISRVSPTGTFTEVEDLLRRKQNLPGGGFERGYECLLSGYGQYYGVVRHNGDGTFTGLAGNGSHTPPRAPAHGDVWYAEIVGTIITLKLAGQIWLIYDVASNASTPLIFDISGNTLPDADGSALVFTDGDPGMGFDTNGDDAAFGFSSITARGL